MPSRLIWSSSNYSIQYLDFWLWFTVLWFEDKEIMPYTHLGHEFSMPEIRCGTNTSALI